MSRARKTTQQPKLFPKPKQLPKLKPRQRSLRPWAVNTNTPMQASTRRLRLLTMKNGIFCLLTRNISCPPITPCRRLKSRAAVSHSTTVLYPTTTKWWPQQKLTEFPLFPFRATEAFRDRRLTSLARLIIILPSAILKRRLHALPQR